LVLVLFGLACLFLTVYLVEICIANCCEKETSRPTCYCELAERINEEPDPVSCCWEVLLLLWNAARCSWNIT